MKNEKKKNLNLYSRIENEWKTFSYKINNQIENYMVYFAGVITCQKVERGKSS